MNAEPTKILLVEDNAGDARMLQEVLAEVPSAPFQVTHAISRKKADQVHSRRALVMTLTQLVACRSRETGLHLLRLQQYSCCLARAAANFGVFANQVDECFIEMLSCCAPLHDIGKFAIPDYIFLKPGKLTRHERFLMQAHTTIGAAMLTDLARKHGFTRPFLRMAIDTIRHHHERYDGTGYPDQLAGNEIPLAARIVAIGDVYDALRSRRVYKPAMRHGATMRKMARSFRGHFDPDLMRVFQQCHLEFARIFRKLADARNWQAWDLIRPRQRLSHETKLHPS